MLGFIVYTFKIRIYTRVQYYFYQHVLDGELFRFNLCTNPSN